MYVDKNLNEYGHSEIHSSEFKKISRKKYKDILLHMKSKGILWTNSSIGDNHLGLVSPGGKHIIRGYNFQRDFKNRFKSDIQNYFEKVPSANEKSDLQKKCTPETEKSDLQKKCTPETEKSDLQKKCTPETEKSVPFALSKTNKNSISNPVSITPPFSFNLMDSYDSNRSTLFLTEQREV